ncbi:MAG: DNA polymerase III subunit chi [Neisseria sp.]|uniref:DNA polymerase III subunit chi n=1 Tax=Neisseria sp. TaxID=192066 RepID=UPI0026DA7D39|nr:DNA polymerase III subunit chi [Neisseria sp.]MDO4640528.1 DNA polymerase III subunit chi [Neisseria sp.]
MSQATFYTHVADCAGFICRLSARAVSKGERVLVWADDEAQMARIDADLWANPPEGFLPHEIWQEGSTYPEDVPLVLAFGIDLPAVSDNTVVLNVSESFWCDAPVPPKRVLEIVGGTPDDLAAARERFRAYRQKGFAIDHHNMQGKG